MASIFAHLITTIIVALLVGGCVSFLRLILSFIDKKEKRSFKEITPEECLAVAKLMNPLAFVNTRTGWKAEGLGNSTHEHIGFMVLSPNTSKYNHYVFTFDFEMETIAMSNKHHCSGNCGDNIAIAMQLHFEIITYLNEHGIYFDWQNEID